MIVAFSSYDISHTQVSHCSQLSFLINLLTIVRPMEPNKHLAQTLIRKQFVERCAAEDLQTSPFAKSSFLIYVLNVFICYNL